MYIYIYNIYAHWMSQAKDMGFNAVELKSIHTLGVLASNRFQHCGALTPQSWDVSI
jgi:hypothetical protein